MSKIINPIGPRNFEIIRDQICAILADELANQAVLQPTETVLTAKVFKERFTPFNFSEEQIVTVMYNGSSFPDKTHDQSTNQCTYFIDCYTSGKANSIANGDTRSLLDLQRLLGVIMNILDSPYYLNLDFQTNIIQRRMVKSIRISEPQDNKDGAFVMMGRLAFEVTANETTEQITPTVLNEATTTVNIEESDEGLFYEVAT